MSEHVYVRELLPDNRFDIDHPDRVDGEGEQIHLAKEAENAIPGKDFVLRCNGTEARFIFEENLEPSEVATLDATVAAHKANA